MIPRPPDRPTGTFLSALRWATGTGFYVYVGIFIVAGLQGLLFPLWGPLKFEVFARVIFGLPMPAEDLASTLSHFRFMRSVELGFGAFALLFRREIFTAPKFNRFFLAVLFLAVGARALSWLLDGRPHAAYLGFMFGEFLVGLLVLAYSRLTLVRR